MCLQHWIKLPRLVFSHNRLNFVATGLKRSAFQAHRKQLLALFPVCPAGHNHFHRAVANERTMFAALADSGLIIFMKIAGGWVRHRADVQRSTICKGANFVRLQKPESFHRHFDQRIGQSLGRGLLEPLFQVFSKCRHW